MKRRLIILSGLIIVIALLLVIVFLIPQKSSCKIEELILDQNVLPPGWEIEWKVLPPALPLKGAENGVNVVFWKDENDFAIIQNTIYLYKNQYIASFYYWFNHRAFFPENTLRWSDAESIAQWNFNWNEGKIRCGTSEDHFSADICIAVLRYGPIIIDLVAPVEEDYISQQEFQEMVLSLNKGFDSCRK